MSGTRAISTTWRRKLSSSFFSLQGKAPKEIHAILTGTLACFLPGLAKDLSAPLCRIGNRMICNVIRISCLAIVKHILNNVPLHNTTCCHNTLLIERNYFANDFSKEQRTSLRMILGSKHVGSDFKCFNVKFYVSALVGVIIKVILRNARCKNKEIFCASNWLITRSHCTI